MISFVKQDRICQVHDFAKSNFKSFQRTLKGRRKRVNCTKNIFSTKLHDIKTVSILSSRQGSDHTQKIIPNVQCSGNLHWQGKALAMHQFLNSSPNNEIFPITKIYPGLCARVGHFSANTFVICFLMKFFDNLRKFFL